MKAYYKRKLAEDFHECIELVTDIKDLARPLSPVSPSCWGGAPDIEGFWTDSEQVEDTNTSMFTP